MSYYHGRRNNSCMRCGDNDHNLHDCPVVWCKVCGKSFGDYQTLDANNNLRNSHMRILHKTCDRCGGHGHEKEGCPVVWCEVCGQCFSKGSLAANVNSRKMHMETHKPRYISCPRKQFGGDCNSTKLFKTGACATAHVEAGGCGQGRERGQDEVYNFLRSTAPHLINKPLGYQEGYGQRPEYAYKCNFCDRIFKMASSLTQHSDAVHGVRFC